MIKKLVVVILSFGTICLLLLLCFPHKIVLNIGIFAGSNWDVPSGDSYKVIDQAIETFEAKNPLVEIEYVSGILKDDYSNWLSSLYLQGKEPDVFMVLNEDFNTLSSLGALQDLSEFIDNDHTFNSGDFYKSALEAGKYQGNQYALPYESNPTLMFVNKTLLGNENIALPDNSWTLDEFYQICKQVTKDTDGDGQIDQYGCYDFDWLDSIYSHNVELFNSDGTECYLNQESVKNAITFITKLNELNQGHTVTSIEFDEGKVAFSPMPFSQYRTYKPYPWRVKKYSQFEWDCVKMPGVATSSQSEVSSLLMGISSRTSYSQTAWEFLKMLTYDQETQQNLFQYSQGISSLKSVMSSSETLALLNEEILGDTKVDLSLLNEVMENTVGQDRFKKYTSALNLMDTEIQNIIRDNEDIDLSLMDLQKEINKYLEE